MANYVPLIINPGSTQIQELPANDNLDLANSSIANVVGITATGNIATGNILTDGYYYANGSPFIAGSNYGDSNVATFLGTFGSNNISTTGNVTAGYVLGNAAFMTGIPTSYGDSNVATLMSNFGSNTIVTTGNVSGGNLSASGVLTVTGNATVSGTGSNLIRRAAGAVAADTSVILDNVEAFVYSGTNQLYIYLNSGTWQATGVSETFQGGGSATNYWINIPISSTGTPNGFAMTGAMPNQGHMARLTFSDQTNADKMFRVTVIRAGSGANPWNITIERLL